ncbi:MAG: hypothetical protein DMD71_08010 [Gemmatimonadetes bacterium]|nr:MAG: hypothetical protein DMD74_07675 [Gemmatimonadota bacterium]PYO67069.1 MAG: hypothetical protein DMD71_08010 [Gemmatimonadota bacterium]
MRATCRPAVVPRLVRALRQIVGAPDYEGYVEHCRQRQHPPLTEREYVREFFENKGKATRCC